MFNFFAAENSRNGNSYTITDGDFNHIKNVLRMKEGDTFLISENGISNLCILKNLESDFAVAEITEENYNNTELPIEIHLFLGKRYPRKNRKQRTRQNNSKRRKRRTLRKRKRQKKRALRKCASVF